MVNDGSEDERQVRPQGYHARTCPLHDADNLLFS